MAKQGGLGANFYFGGYDLSNDVGSVGKISGSIATFDVTGINVSGYERIGGRRDGGIDFVPFFNPSTGRAHPVLSALPLGDQVASYFHTPAIGSPAASMVGKQLNYDGTRSAAGDLTFAVATVGDGFGLEWGDQLTPGIRTDTVATNGVAFNSAPSLTTPAVPASATPVTNTSGYPVQVVITGGTMTNVSVNGATVGAGAGTYPVLPGQTISMTYTVAPTWSWQYSTGFGAQAYLQVFGFTGTDATVKIQDSADNVTFADVAGMAFAQITAVTPQSQRIAAAGTLRQYVRAVTVTTGGFTSLAFAVQNTRNLTAVTF
jgi:hypothetical protein